MVFIQMKIKNQPSLRHSRERVIRFKAMPNAFIGLSRMIWVLINQRLSYVAGRLVRGLHAI